MNSAFLEHYRCPESFADFTLCGTPTGTSGYFRFGPDAVCYGRCSGATPAGHARANLWDALSGVASNQNALQLPFNLSEIAANLRFERYVSAQNGPAGTTFASPIVQNAYYLVRPLLPVLLRKYLQRMRLGNWRAIPFPTWPVDMTVERIFERVVTLLLKGGSIDKFPFVWFWPRGYPACAIMTHDVETQAGKDFCPRLMDIDDAYGIKSSFQIIPEERYTVTSSFLGEIRRRGFEINIHDLNHDGRLLNSRDVFLRRAKQINRYGVTFGAAGFRSGVLYRNLDWYYALDFSYDMSVPSVAHLEPQRGGCCTAMPFFIGKILELPVSATQDYSLFHILGEYSAKLWKHQVEKIRERQGLASFIVHPDYLSEARARDTYQALLAYLSDLRREGKIWIALPGEVNRWWRARSKMKLAWQDNNWVVEGPESDKACVAYAVLKGETLVYEFPSPGTEVVGRGLSRNESLPGMRLSDVRS